MIKNSNVAIIAIIIIQITNGIKFNSFCLVCISLVPCLSDSIIHVSHRLRSTIIANQKFTWMMKAYCMFANPNWTASCAEITLSVSRSSFATLRPKISGNSSELVPSMVCDEAMNGVLKVTSGVQ